MSKLAGCLLFSVFFLSASSVFAQNSDGVLVSPPIQGQGSDQGNTGNNGGGDNGSNANAQGSSNGSGQHKHHHADGGSDASSQSATESGSNSGNLSNTLPTDDIIVKATNAAIFQMTTNLKLTQDQISAATPIITDNIVAVRNLQQSLENGDIDSSTMVSQKKQLLENENQALSSFLSSDQMKTWIEMQNQSAPKNKESSSK